MKRAQIDSLPRTQIDQILYNAMAAVYQFDQQKINLFGMTYQDSYLLYYLRRHSPVRMSSIALELSVHISTASRAVDRLERRKLVKRSKDPADKRNILVMLEEEGEELMKASEEHSYERIRTGMQDYSAEELAAIMKAAANLSAILGVPSLNGDPAASSAEKGAGIKRRR
jgi:MarR family transcriptional regulator, organic hydroperoxide resistance regulator